MSKSNDLFLEYMLTFDPLGYFDPDEVKVSEPDLQRCLDEGKTVYELGIVKGPDPARITKKDDNGSTAKVWHA